MDYSNILSEMSEGIRKKEFAVFCGAGISKNSGLPLADELKQYILEKLPINEDIEEIMNSKLPFEAFMEAISGEDIVSSSIVDISNILEIYKHGKPNTNHILMAKLAKNGYLKTIFTTNFDLLIERALENEGLEKGKHFEVYCNEEQFSEIDFENIITDKTIKIFKIHGSVDNEGSIKTTMRAVANKTLSDKRMSVIRYLLSTGKHKQVVILGYSCSDRFDITPQIQSIEENQKEIIFVEHVENIKIKDYQKPFKKFSEKRVRCKTDNFVEHLWDSLKENIGEYVPVNKDTTEWKGYVNDWVKLLEKNKGSGYYITGLVFYKISSFNEAAEYYEKALTIARDIGNKRLESRCYGGLARSHYRLGNFNEAIKHYNNALEIAIIVGDKILKSRCNIGLGYSHYRLGHFNEAIKYYKKALEIIKRDLVDEIEKKMGKSRCYLGLCFVYANLCDEDFNKALEYHKKALEIALEIGDKEGEPGCYRGLGYYHFRLGNFNKAIKCYKKALEIALEMGDKAIESECYRDVGNTYNSLREFNKAIKLYEKSLKINKEIEDKALEPRCGMGLGNAYRGLRDFNKAIEYYSKAEKIFKEIGQKHYLKIIYGNIAITYLKMNNPEKAGEYRKLYENF